jgi:hypothetical protein
MNQKSARQAIVEEWERLPLQRRQTEDQAVAFIFNLMGRRPELFQFKYRKNPVETILCWLLPTRQNAEAAVDTPENAPQFTESRP